MRRVMAVVCAVVILMGAGVARAQSTGNVLGQLFGSIMEPMVNLMEQPVVTGDPYTGKHYRHEEKMLADGTKIAKHGTHHLVERDTEGRVREEHMPLPGMKVVYVKDPVKKTLTFWIEVSNTDKDKAAAKQAEMFNAYEMKLPDASKLKGKVVTTEGGEQYVPEDADWQKKDVKKEDLGQQSMQGLLVTGTRWTRVIAAGSEGNDAPITRTLEVWYSKDLRVAVQRVLTDPRIGVRTWELQGITRESPDGAQFKPPAGYSIKTNDQMMKEMKDKMAAQATAAPTE